jgi:hypothetical protein
MTTGSEGSVFDESDVMKAAPNDDLAPVTWNSSKWELFLKIILGFNAVSLLKGFRMGPRKMLGGALRGFDACDLWEKDHRYAQRLIVRIPEVSLLRILAGRRVPLHLTVRNYEDGMLRVEHAIALLSIAVAENPQEVLEIGTFCGNTTLLLAQNLPSALIHTIDLPLDFSPEATPVKVAKDDFHLIRERVVGREYKDTPEAKRIIQHYGDSATWDFSPVKNVTFFFIDGSHTYEHCKIDSENCYRICNGQAVFLWHDCDIFHPGVLEFILEWRALGRNIVRIRGTSLAYWKSYETAEPGSRA